MNPDTLIQLFEYRTGYAPDLDNPRTYCEKALWSKLYNQDPRLIQYGDKLVAKEVLKGSKITPIPTTVLDPSRCPDLPAMVRINNRSGFSRIIKTPKQWQNFIHTLPRKPYGREKREWHYQYMDTHILVEPIIENFLELKFFCFGGEVHYVYEVGKEHKTFFNLSGEPLPITQQINNKQYQPDTSAQLYIPNGWLLEEVEKLAKGFPHIRVDLMITPDQVYLSEFTFFHFSGMLKFKPKEFDYELGEPWQITE